MGTISKILEDKTMVTKQKKDLKRVSSDITEEELLRLVKEGRIYIEEK